MIEIRKMQLQDIPDVCAFVKTVFDEYLSCTYFVTENDGEIVSHIEIRKNSHICLPFTHTLHQ